MKISALTYVSEMDQIQLTEALNVLTHGRYIQPLPVDNITKVLAQPNTHVLVMRDEGRIVGVSLHYFQRTLTRKVVVTEEIAVLPEYQGRGIATALLECAVAYAHSQGADCLENTIVIKNEASEKCHERIGYVRRPVQGWRYVINKF